MFYFQQSPIAVNAEAAACWDVGHEGDADLAHELLRSLKHYKPKPDSGKAHGKSHDYAGCSLQP